MKLDKMAFAHVLAHCISNGMSAGEYEVNELDNRISFNIPEQTEVKASGADIELLMALMAQGNHKIEAIKVHRTLTGYGLKESKDVIERYWQQSSADKLLKRIQDALGTSETGDALVEVASNAHKAERELASQHNFDEDESRNN